MRTIDHNAQASLFAKNNGIKLKVLNEEFGRYFPDDKQSRSIFKLRLSRNKKSYTFKFGQSIASRNTKPTMYDVLACLTKYDVGSFEDFCSEFGYDNDSKVAERTYNAVVKEYEAVERLFGDIINELQEIQ